MNNNTINITLISLSLILGVYLCIIGGYGSDEDTLPMIGTFANFLDGNFMTSRFTGYPVAEFIIGFFSYYFGSATINIVVFFSFILGCFIFFISLEKNFKKNYIFFLLLVISNPILFFDNLEPVDYSLGFLFLSLGFYFLKSRRIELAIVFFGISIGTRINLAPFVIIMIYFNSFNFSGGEFRKFIIIICALFIGSLFYLTVWIHSELTLRWLTAGRPDGGIFEYGSRFLYKTLISFGIIQTIILLIFILNKNYKKNLSKKNNFIYYLIIANLLIFFYIPAELSYLQPGLIFLYYLIYKYFNQKIIYILIAINFFSWIVNFETIEIIHKNTDKCEPIVAINAKVNPRLEKGYFYKYIDSRSKINCWIDLNSDYGKKVSKGLPLK